MFYDNPFETPKATPVTDYTNHVTQITALAGRLLKDDLIFVAIAIVSKL